MRREFDCDCERCYQMEIDLKIEPYKKALILAVQELSIQCNCNEAICGACETRAQISNLLK